jgi:hypothetical protein
MREMSVVKKPINLFSILKYCIITLGLRGTSKEEKMKV